MKYAFLKNAGILPLALLIAILLTFSGCSGKKDQGVLHIRVINGGFRSGHLGEKITDKWTKTSPATITLKLEDKTLVSAKELKPDAPLDIEQQLKPGQYALHVEETGTGASQRTILPLTQNSYVRVTFIREGPKMGYFEVESRPDPWDSDSWKKKGNTSGDLMNDDEIEKRFDDLKKDAVRKPEKPVLP